MDLLHLDSPSAFTTFPNAPLSTSRRTALFRAAGPHPEFTFCLSPYEGESDEELPSADRYATLLRKEMLAKKWKPQVVSIGHLSDAYLAREERLGLTRAALEVFREFRNPVHVITHSSGVLRDRDLLSEMSARQIGAVSIRVSSGGGTFSAPMETLSSLARADIHSGLRISPAGLTEHELSLLLKATSEAGGRFVRLEPLRTARKSEKAQLARLQSCLEREAPQYGLAPDSPPLSLQGFRKVEDSRQMWLFG